MCTTIHKFEASNILYFKKVILLFRRNVLNGWNMIVKACIVRKAFFILNKCSSFKLCIHQRIKEKNNHMFQKQYEEFQRW